MSEDNIVSVCLEANLAVWPKPSGWSQHLLVSATLVNQTDNKCNIEVGQTSHTCKASVRVAAIAKVIDRFVLYDIITYTEPSMGYIVNDTLIIKCDMTHISSSNVSTAADTPTARVTIPAVWRSRLDLCLHARSKTYFALGL